MELPGALTVTGGSAPVGQARTSSRLAQRSSKLVRTVATPTPAAPGFKQALRVRVLSGDLALNAGFLDKHGH